MSTLTTVTDSFEHTDSGDERRAQQDLESTTNTTAVEEAADANPRPSNLNTDFSLKLPIEVWNELCDLPWPWTLYKNDYRNLSLTCKLFCAVFQKMVFVEVLHDVSSHLVRLQSEQGQIDEPRVGAVPALFESASAFGSALYNLSESYPRLGTPPPHALSHTRTYSFSGAGISELYLQRGLTEQAWTSYETTLDLFSRVLRQFTALQRLHLNRLTVGENMLESIALLPELKTLRFIDAHFPSRTLPSDRLITVEDLDFWGSSSMVREPLVPLELFSSKQLTTLRVESTTEGPNFLTHFIQQGPAEHLQSLEIDINSYENLPILFRFIARCPSLESLGIQCYMVRSEDWIPAFVLAELQELIPASALPRLREFKGPSEIASILVPNRPVTRLTMFSAEWTDGVWERMGIPTLKAISRSSGPIKELSLPLSVARPEVFTTIAKYFPALWRLELVLDDRVSVSVEDERADHGHEVTIAVDEEGNPLSTANSFKGIIERLALGIIDLPPSLMCLIALDNAFGIAEVQGRLQMVREQPTRTCMTRPALYNAICEISKRYPSLLSVALGLAEIRWRKHDDGDWKPDSFGTMWYDPDR